MLFTIMYLCWRIFFTIPFEYGIVSIVAGFALLIVEVLGMVEAFVHYANMYSVKGYDLPEIPVEMYPDVDIFIATYSEEPQLLYKTIIEEYAENPRTIVISTHLIEEIATIIENVVVLHDCKVVLSESTENLLEKGYSVKGNSTEVEEFIKDKNCLGVEKVGTVAVAYLLEKRPENISKNIEVSGLNLQKIFVKLTGGES